MKIRTRVSLISILILVIAIISTVSVTIYNIKRKAKDDIARYEKQELDKVKQNLKNFVDLAYETVNANYQTTCSQQYLEKFYGERLKNMVNVVYDVVQNNYKNAQNREYLEKFYGHRLRNILEVAESILQENADLVKSGKLTLQQAQKQAKESIRRIRYNNSGYIWVNDMTLPYPKMIVHPTVPALNDKVLDDPKFNCALGRKQNLFQAAVELCKKKGSGYLDYTWPKPGPNNTLIPNVPKLSYVRVFKPWNWMMGVGIYIDDAIEDAKQLSLEEIKAMRYDKGTGYFWINGTDEPYPKMIMHPISPKLNNTVLSSPTFNSVGPKKQNLFQALVETCKENGQGFVFYEWPKPLPNGKKGPKQPKLTYVKKYTPWNWIIGTGIYLDDAVGNAKQTALSEIQKLRYDNGVGYFWVNDTGKPYPKMIMHSIASSLNNKELNNPKYNCALGKNVNLFKAMVDICEKDGHGFVDYNWPKPTKDGLAEKVEPKLSYVRLFKPWNWVIGTGVYIDHIKYNIQQEQERIQCHVNMLIFNILVISAVVIVIAVIVCFIFANSLSAPIMDLIGTMKKVDLVNISSIQTNPRGAEEIKELGSIFNGMTKSLHDAVELLRDTTAAKEKIESELNVARDIQMSIIPKLFPAFPERPEFDVYASLRTAKAVGGDLYDFFFIDDDHLCFTIGDVSGKGVPASLFMAVTRTLLRAKTKAGLSTGQITTEINDTLCIDNEQSMFVTMLFFILNVKTGTLNYCNAGHNPAYIIRNQMTLEKLDKIHGVPLGVMDEIPYGNDEVILKPGDTLVLYTDGVTEAHNINNELFEDERLEKLLEESKMYSPKAIVDVINQKVDEFAGEAEQADDITLLALNYRGNVG